MEGLLNTLKILIYLITHPCFIYALLNLSKSPKTIKIDRNMSKLWQIVCNVKHRVFLSDFNENLNFLEKFSQNARTTNFEKTRPVKLSYSVRAGERTDGRTDMTKLTVAFRNFAKAHKIHIHTDNTIWGIYSRFTWSLYGRYWNFVKWIKKTSELL